MHTPPIVSREDWNAAREALLVKEKSVMRAHDALAAERRRIPWMAVDKAYAFVGPRGKASLLDLFEGRRQLIVYHFMYSPDWDAGCSSCTAGTDEISQGFLDHLHVRDTTFAMVSLAPYAKLAKWEADRGWTIPWYSSYGTDFNYDFDVTLDPSVKPPVYNYRPIDLEGEMPGQSAFLRDGDRVFHTYSWYARAAEATGGSYYWLDMTALGRQEDWEEPKGRADLERAAQPNFAT